MLTAWGIWAMTRTPLDAVPDISDVQVIVSTEWMGRSPDLIEDQITYPIVSALISTPHVKAVRGFTDFGISYVYVIFQDRTDIYWARSRVLEYLQGVRGQLPEGVNPMIGPDATGVGWVFEYALTDETGQHTLAELRSFQDWNLRYWLAAVPGVAEVASIGGFVKQYQVNVDPEQAGGLQAVDHGGHQRDQGQQQRRRGPAAGVCGPRVHGARARLHHVRSTTSRTVAVGLGPQGVPIRVSDVGEVRLGPDLRRGAADLDGRGETVGGIVVMRFGENALSVIDAVKAKLREVQKVMPAGMTIVPTYDRSDLDRRIDRDAAAHAHRGGGGRVAGHHHLPLPLPIGAGAHPRAAGRRRRVLHPDVLPRGHVQHHVARRAGAGDWRAGRCLDRDGGERVPARRRSRRRCRVHDGHQPAQAILRAAKQVGRPIFFSLAIIIVSFLPVFLLEAQEGRMFRPLAFTKTFAMAAASVLAVTLVPVLMILLVRGRRLRPESRNPVSRVFAVRLRARHPAGAALEMDGAPHQSSR